MHDYICMYVSTHIPISLYTNKSILIVGKIYSNLFFKRTEFLPKTYRLSLNVSLENRKLCFFSIFSYNI